MLKVVGVFDTLLIWSISQWIRITRFNNF